jgi:four helix bundle protein
MRNYKNYEVWQNAMQLTNVLYDFCQKFPKSELYGLRSQIQRASVSIACNIAEGSAKSSKKDFKRILEISLGSAFEL